MVAPLQSLMNMEYMLYGSTGYGMSGAPSMLNNYRANSSYSTYVNPYGYNPTFGQTIPSAYSSQNTQQTSNSAFTGLSDRETKALVDEYTKSLAPSESFLGAAANGTAFAVLFHPRAIFHPINTWKSFAETDKIFAALKDETSVLAKASKQPGLNEAIREAYAATNRVVARSYKEQKWYHMWRNGFEKAGLEAGSDADRLLEPIKKILKNFDPKNPKDVEALIRETERLNQANIKNGALPKAWNWVKNLVRSESQEIPSALAKFEDGKVIAESSTKAENTISSLLKANEGKSAAEAIAKGKGYLQTLKTSGGGLGGAALFMGIEFLTGISKIKAAFGKDKETGWKQVGQTTVKGAGSAIGWAAGEALGTWGCAKLLAAAGTAIAPGVGTAIGAIAGMTVGSLGMWLTGKLTHKLVGQDLGDKVEAENMAKSSEGQVQLLQHTMEKMQKGEKVDPQAQAAVQKLIAQYSAA